MREKTPDDSRLRRRCPADLATSTSTPWIATMACAAAVVASEGDGGFGDALEPGDSDTSTSFPLLLRRCGDGDCESVVVVVVAVVVAAAAAAADRTAAVVADVRRPHGCCSSRKPFWERE